MKKVDEVKKGADWKDFKCKHRDDNENDNDSDNGSDTSESVLLEYEEATDFLEEDKGYY